MDDPHARPVEIRDEVIRLGQLLQLAGIVDSGSDAKAVLTGEEVLVNGEVETRRGRQLRRGDVVAAFDEVIVVSSPPTG
jgi:ribosome-associated protein